MKAGFYTIMAAQFFSSLADNALLIAAIALLRDLAEPAWMTPALKMSSLCPTSCWRRSSARSPTRCPKDA